MSVLAVARHEARRAFAALDKRTGFALLGVAVLLAFSWPIVGDHPPAPQDDLFPVAASDDAVLAEAVRADPRFRLVDGDRGDLASGRVALYLSGDGVAYDDDRPASRAALLALRQATQRWLEGELEGEADEAAAFPVVVDILEEPQDLTASGQAVAGDGGADGADGGGAGGGGTGTAGPSPTGGPGVAELVGDGTGTVEPRIGLRPSEVDPPFPVRSLLLTFAFLIPMNLVAQLCAGSLLSERVRHRGLLVLASPLSGSQILLGRTLPHLALTLGVVLLAGIAIGVGWQGFAAALPMVLLVLAIAVVLGLLARNERELTFLLTAATTMYSTFLFLPAIFTTLPPLAFLSPVSVVAAAVDGVTVPWGRFLYATVPLSLCTVALAVLAAGLYREETLFSTRGLGAKGMEGLRRLVGGRWSLLAAGVLVVPFALALELFILALVIPLGLRAAFPLFVLGVAFVEEALKLLPARAYTQRTGKAGWLAGGLSGVGFFLGEKVALLVALVGFGLLPFGSTSLALWGAGGGLLLLVAPLALHAACSAVAGSGTAKGRRWAVAVYLGGVVLHAAYNVALLARGLG